jgi:TolB-like protein
LSFFDELKRRNVVRVAIAYIVMGWLLTEIATTLLPTFGAPEWVAQVVILVFALGFIPTVVFAWVFELTPDGIRRESEIDRSESIASETGRRLDYITIAAVVLGIGFLAWTRMTPDVDQTGSSTGEAESSVAQPLPSAADSDVSIAVLPFVNMSTDPENEYFADGLSEEILNRLAQVPQLRVVGRTSSFAFKGDNRDLREIGGLLDVATVLEGSVRRQGDQVRVTAQLIESDDGTHLWSQTYDRKIDDVFAIQDEISERVVQALDIVLDDAARAAMLEAGIRNVEAFVAYQRGVALHALAHGEAELLPTLEEGNAFLDQAIALAPQFAAAHLAKADYYAHQILESGVSPDDHATALAEIQVVLGRARDTARDPMRRLVVEIDRILFSDDWTSLRKITADALASSGCESANWIELMVPFVDLDVFDAYFQNQAECNPLYFHSYMMLAETRLLKGDFDGASQILDQGIAAVGQHRYLLGGRHLLLLARNPAGLLEVLDKESSALPPQDDAGFRLAALAALGRVDEARAELEVAMSGNIFRSWIITAHANMGDREAANAKAAELDASPGGAVSLMRAVLHCKCGAPFDLDATPNLNARITEAGLDWPPPDVFEFPAKDW